MRVDVRGVTFYVRGDYSNRWFTNKILSGKWEPHTFEIIERFGDPEKVYLDLGAWIGPTALFGAHLFHQTLAVEPDPVAYERLSENLAANPGIRITPVRTAVAPTGGIATIYADRWGDSKSSLRISPERKAERIVSLSSLESLLVQHEIEEESIGLIKIDIEGGEAELIPSIVPLLRRTESPLYLSVHWWEMTVDEAVDLLRPLFTIYNRVTEKGCNEIGFDQVVKRRVSELLFERV